jgi:RNA polymerase sigma-70 factor (ECF subfamily)
MGAATLTAHGQRQADGDRLLHAFADARGDLTQTLDRMLGNLADAEDAVQEAFLKCWRHRREAAAVADLRAWIFRVGLNAAHDLQRSAWHRRARRFPAFAEVDAWTELPPVEQAVRGESLERLRQALGGLRPEERAVFLLRQNSDRTYEQIAALRRAPVGTVKTQMRAALHKLRLVLQGDGAMPEAGKDVKT